MFLRKNKILRHRQRLAQALALLAVASLAGGCRQQSQAPKEVVYMAAPQVNLRDRVATVFNKTGTVMNGERLEVLEHTHNGRFVRVRDPRNEEGWMEGRYTVSSAVFDRFQLLAGQSRGLPTQAHAVTRNETNMHVMPSRESEHLYLLPEGEKLELLKRAVAPRTGIAEPQAQLHQTSLSLIDKPEATAEILEDWWLVRNAHQRYGWVLARMVDIDVPLDVAQYAEGQRIIADFILNTVSDGGKQVPQYLLLLNEPKDGEPQDFNQIRVFTWNLKRHRYETAYREHGLFGVLPVEVGKQDFGKEGRMPVATIQTREKSGNLVQSKYRLDGVMFRRVFAPGEQPTRSIHPRRKP